MKKEKGEEKTRLVSSEELRKQVLEVRKKNELKEKIKFLKSRIDFESETIFNQILKQLGYEC